ncbi:MAG TPA: iron-containing alcohol dehydrogenase, partial [Chloroflexota bacterium]
MDLSRTFTWEMPARLVVGLGCSRSVGAELKKLGVGKVLIVTDRGVEGAGILSGIVEALDAAGVGHAIYNGVEANPSIKCVNEAAALYKAEGCSGFLGIGGGSSMDTAKAAGSVLANPDVDIRAMEGAGHVPNPIPPLVAIPTTCGTGSEVTSAAVITDTERHY